MEPLVSILFVMKGLKLYFGEGNRASLENQVVSMCRDTLDQFIAFREEQKNEGYLNFIKEAMAESKRDSFVLCFVKFVPDCSVDSNTGFEFKKRLSITDMATAHVTMGNHVWDSFYKYSDLWIDIFIRHVQEKLTPMCAENGWRAYVVQEYPDLRNKGTICIRCEVLFRNAV